MEETLAESNAKKLNAKNAWIFPLSSWLVTVLATFFHLNVGAFVNLALALVELVVIILGTYIGIKVLTDKKNLYSQKERNHAIIGLILVGITLLIILIAIVTS